MSSASSVATAGLASKPLASKPLASKPLEDKPLKNKPLKSLEGPEWPEPPKRSELPERPKRAEQPKSPERLKRPKSPEQKNIDFQTGLEYEIHREGFDQYDQLVAVGLVQPKKEYAPTDDFKLFHLMRDTRGSEEFRAAHWNDNLTEAKKAYDFAAAKTAAEVLALIESLDCGKSLDKKHRRKRVLNLLLK